MHQMSAGDRSGQKVSGFSETVMDCCELPAVGAGNRMNLGPLQEQERLLTVLSRP